MSDPIRWREDPDVTFRARSLLAAARIPRPLSPAERARSTANIERLALAPAAPALSPFGVLRGKGAALIVAGAMALGGAALVGTRTSTMVVGERPTPRPVDVSRAGPDPSPAASIAPDAPPRVDEPKAVLPPVAAPPPAKRARTDPTAAEDDSLRAEMRLIDAASAELKARPVAALDLLNLHAQRFPDGILASEREVLAVDALGRLDRGEDARARADAFFATNASSLYRQRVNRILAKLR